MPNTVCLARLSRLRQTIFFISSLIGGGGGGWARLLLSVCVYLDWDLERGEGHFWYVSCMQKLRPVLAKFRTCLNLASPKHPPCCFKCNQGLYLYKF